MAINASSLTDHVIKPTLDYLGMPSLAAEQLLQGTAARGSDFDPLSQRGQGIGIYQITSKQHRHVWDNYLAFRPDLASKVRGLASQHQFLKEPDQELKTNLAYATAIALVIFLHSGLHLPVTGNAPDFNQCWQANANGYPATPQHLA